MQYVHTQIFDVIVSRGEGGITFEKQKLLNRGEGGITFEVDTTKEFTRSLRFQNNVKKDEKKKKEEEQQNFGNVPPKETTDNSLAIEVVTMKEDKSDETDNMQTLEVLAREVKDEPDGTDTFEGSSTSVVVGRGMSAFLGLLKQTGEFGKRSCREELRGRAKDERTYEDYESIDLKKVVKLDTTGLNGRPHEKDIELANREVKLEYRDEHGRLLTRKEAFRQLCYQFHGHGSSKRKEEKKLQQIKREQSEKSGKHSSIFSAFKATKKATGKAFVLHKT
ncbi:U4/U6.U5 tri-snRNP-associated protein 1 [Chaetoceros tenuissimus]|uniref:U4/U6.U5 tri-snRNP-associated protein 1 n=1 Tax=Chaetoceros tenuissimus TaxID=426638 RepID=A0AAD3HAS7_9STRA|nr:U4/U6.U5 tri-snRNP-associated protein 1 [Chaetoceros tenuissimus]GFH56718.1 U4/U6.U5 tri-snRNP-associated protein 1 [Chaetoceros tenuissimus]